MRRLVVVLGTLAVLTGLTAAPAPPAAAVVNPWFANAVWNAGSMGDTPEATSGI